MAETTAKTPKLDTQVFRDVFNASPIGIAVENLEGKPLFVNPAFCSFLGFSEEEMCSKHCVDFSPSEDAEKDWELFQQLRAGSIDHYQLEKRYFRRDATLVWGRLSIWLMKSRPSPLVIAMIEDITEKKTGEESLHESEERLRLAVQAGKMFAYSWDAATDVIERSGESAEILGVKSDQAATGAAISAMVHPDDKQRLEAALSNLKVENPTLQITYRIIRPDGAVTSLERNSRAYFDVQGKLKRIVGMIADVTERKRAEEIRFRHAAVIESSEDAIASGTLDGIIVSWNAGAERMYGYTEAEAVGKPVTILVPPELPNEENKILETLKAGGRIEHFETVRVTKTGRRIDVSLTISPIKDASGKTVGISGIGRDITERKQAEQALHAHQELLKIFVKNVPAAVAMLDRDMHYLQVSDRWCTDYLSGRAQILGRSHYELFPDMPERWKEVHRRALAGETLRADEDHWEGQDGPHWARWEVRPWKTAEGTVGGILILAEDITRRKQMEVTLSTMTRKLIDAQEQERARIARELHDDIAQRLAMLGIELTLLQENHPDLPSEVSSRVDEMRKETAEISSDLQALSHELHSSKLEYLGVVAGMKSWCQEVAERQKVEIDFQGDVSSALPPEIGLTLFRVLQEALHNALRHSGVKRVEIQLREDPGEIHLIVSDLGRGFDLETALQAKGLGLDSMRERVRLVNGAIAIHSKSMGGTSIHVRVPLEPEHGSELAAG